MIVYGNPNPKGGLAIALIKFFRVEGFKLTFSCVNLLGRKLIGGVFKNSKG